MSSNNFDHDRMLQFSIAAIQEFAFNHQEEVFYGFSIYDSLLCLNSEQQFSKSLTRYLSWYPWESSDSEEIQESRLDPGEWAYRGFANLRDSGGFDDRAYKEYCEASDEERQSTPYALSIDKLVHELISKDAFLILKRTNNFFANRDTERL
jgi:hypothetical protein